MMLTEDQKKNIKDQYTQIVLAEGVDSDKAKTMREQYEFLKEMQVLCD